MIRTLTLPSTLALLLLSTLPVWAGEGVLVGSENHRVIDVVMPPKVLLNETLEPGKPFRLPKLWVYDDHGRQLWAKVGLNREAFPQSLETALRSTSPDPEAPLLESRLDHFTTPDGEPLDPLPPAQATVVKYWADWCQPCKEQSKLLSEVLARHPDMSINVLHVEVELKKLDGMDLPVSGKPAGLRMLPGELDAETKKKLESGELSPEEVKVLLEELEAADYTEQEPGIPQQHDWPQAGRLPEHTARLGHPYLLSVHEGGEG